MGPHGRHQFSNKREPLKSVYPVESSEVQNIEKKVVLISFSFFEVG